MPDKFDGILHYREVKEREISVKPLVPYLIAFVIQDFNEGIMIRYASGD